MSAVTSPPHQGATHSDTHPQVDLGGKGANQAAMAAKLGSQVPMVARLRRDVSSRDILGNFQAWGIDTRHVLLSECACPGVADQEVQNDIIVVGGTNKPLTPKDVEAAHAAIEGASVLVCQLEIPVGSSLAAMEIAHAAGATTLLKPSPASGDLPDRVYQLVDILCLNENETEMLTGNSASTLAEAHCATAALRQRGIPTVILTLGDRGSLLVTSEGARHLPATVVDLVDTTGAGDCCVGSLEFFLAADHELWTA